MGSRLLRFGTFLFWEKDNDYKKKITPQVWRFSLLRKLKATMAPPHSPLPLLTRRLVRNCHQGFVDLPANCKNKKMTLKIIEKEKTFIIGQGLCCAGLTSRARGTNVGFSTCTATRSNPGSQSGWWRTSTWIFGRGKGHWYKHQDFMMQFGLKILLADVFLFLGGRGVDEIESRDA